LAKRYLGSPNEELDLMFAELESIDRTTKEGRRAYHALSRKIRRARESRIFSGLKGLFSRKYPVPAGASGAASTMGFAGMPAIPMPSLGTTAQTQPQPQIPIEEILVSASRREVPEAKPQFDVSSKLGRNQLRSLQKRARRMRETPDAYERNPDYAIEFLPDYLRNQYRDELMQLAGRYNEGRMIGKGGMLFDPTDPTDVALLGLGMAPIPGARVAAGAGKLRKLAKLKDFRKSNFIRDNKTRDAQTILAKNVKKADDFSDTKGLAGLISAMMAGVMGGQYFGDKKKAENLRKFMEGNERDAERSRQRQESDQRLEKFFEAYEKDPDAFSKDSMDTLYFIDENGNPISDEEYYSIQRKAGGGQLMGQAQQLANAGRGDDTMLMHVTPDEVAGIASLAPGLMTINPQTGLPEAGLFRDILGFGLPFLLPMLVPGLGAVAAGALGGAGGAAIRGGDFKDILLGGATGALGGKFMENLAQTGAQTAGLTENLASTAVDSTAAIPTQALANANKLSSVLTPEQLVNVENLTSVKGGMDIGGALSTMDLPAAQMANINQAFTPAIGDAAGQIGSLSNMGGTGEIFGNIKSAGLGGLTDQLMTLPGLGTIAGTGLQATRDAERRYEDMLDDMTREKEEREAELYRMHPENIPYYAREGGSLYKKRYIDGDYS
jgi:hypothetical protein